MAATSTTYTLTATGNVGATTLTGFSLDMPSTTKETAKKFFLNYLAENAAVLEANTSTDTTTFPAVAINIDIVMGNKKVVEYKGIVQEAQAAAATTAFNTLLADTAADLTAIGGSAAAAA